MNLIIGAPGHLLHDAVAVALLIAEREQNVKDRRRQWEQRFWFLMIRFDSSLLWLFVYR